MMTRLGGAPRGVLLQPVHHRHGTRTAARPPVQRPLDVRGRPVVLAPRQPVHCVCIFPRKLLHTLPPAVDDVRHAIAGLRPDQHMAPELPVALHSLLDVLSHSYFDGNGVSRRVEIMRDVFRFRNVEKHCRVRRFAHGESFTFPDTHAQPRAGRTTSQRWLLGSARPGHQATRNGDVRSCLALTLAPQCCSTVVTPARSRVSNPSVTGEEA